MTVTAKNIFLIAGEKEENVRLLSAVSKTFPGCSVKSLTPARGLEALRKSRPDLIVLVFDRGLSEAGSLPLLRDVFSQSPEVPLVAVLAPGEDISLVRALREGAMFFLSRDEVPSPRFERAASLALRRSEQAEKRSVDGWSEPLNVPRNLPPISQANGEAFRELGDRYEKLLELSIERQAYRGESDGSGLEEMANRLGALQAGPRDVIDLHSSVLKRKYDPEQPGRYHAYAREARMMLLELMGYLAGFYRGQAIGERQGAEEAGHG